MPHCWAGRLKSKHAKVREAAVIAEHGFFDVLETHIE
jgi:hypothetical protein